MKWLFLPLVTFVLLFSSCKKCIECECSKNGVIYTEKNCAYGGGSSNQTQETWKEQIKKEKGYDTVNCKEVN
jgi:hypothetical protein